MRRRLRSRTVLRLLRSTFLRHFSSSTALRHSRIRFSGRPRQLRNGLPHTPCGIARGRAISPMQHLRNRPRRRIGHRFLRGRHGCRRGLRNRDSGLERLVKHAQFFERQVALDRRHGTGGLQPSAQAASRRNTACISFSVIRNRLFAPKDRKKFGIIPYAPPFGPAERSRRPRNPPPHTPKALRPTRPRTAAPPDPRRKFDRRTALPDTSGNAVPGPPARAAARPHAPGAAHEALRRRKKSPTPRKQVPGFRFFTYLCR